ncbi:MAG: hypothetical protein ACTTJ6_08270 [Treponema sp.]
MKKLVFIFVIFIITVILTGCKLDNKMNEKIKTELIIQNQSSVNVKSVKYNGKSLQGANSEEISIQAGGRDKILLDGESSGYVYFSIVDSLHDKVIQVRSNEVVVVEKGENKVFVITDNTSVVPVGQVVASPIIGIIRPARLHLINQTSANIDNVSFAGKIRKESIAKGNEWTIDFSNEVSSKLQFRLWDAQNKTIDVVLKDELTIKIGETKEVTLTNSHLVIRDGKIDTIKAVLGISSISVVNSSSAEITGLMLGKQTRSELLAKNESWEIDVFNGIDDFLSFEVKTKFKKFLVKCEEAILCGKGEIKTFRITNDTQLKVQNVEKVLKLSDVLNVAHLIFKNKSSANLNNTKYAGFDVGLVQANGVKEVFIFDFSNIPSYLEFSLFQPYNGNTVRVKTQGKLAIAKGEEKTFEIPDDAIVLKENSDRLYLISSLVKGEGILRIENRSSVRTYDINFAGKVFGNAWSEDDRYYLSVNTWDSEKFQYGIDEYISFEVYNCKVRTYEKIELEIGEYKKYVINNDTLVTPIGSSESVKLWKLSEASIVNIINQTDGELKNISYYGAKFGEINEGNGEVAHVFLNINAVSDYISFEITSSIISLPVKVRTYEKFSMTKGEHSNFKITNNMLVIKEGETEKITIKKILGLTTLKIANQTSAVRLEDLQYAEKTRDVLNKDDTWEVDFDDIKEDYINFHIKSYIGHTFYVKTKDKVTLTKGKEKTFFINNDTDVLRGNDVESNKIITFINAGELKIYNSTNVELLEVKYRGVNWEYIGRHDNDIHVYWNFDTTPQFISFEIKRSDGRIQLHTKELISLFSRKRVTFEIDMNTPLIREDTNQETNLKQLGFYGY